MTDLNIIKDTYARMSDKRLLQIAENETGEMMSAAVKVLKDELQKRNLNSSAFNALSQNESMQGTLTDTSALWEQAYAERKNGKTDAEIMEWLKSAGLSEVESRLMIKRLPQTDSNDEVFEELVYKNCANSSVESLFVMLLMFGVSAIFLYFALKMKDLLFFIFSLGAFILAFYLRSKMKGRTKGGAFWVNMLINDPGNIIWVKPIVEKHTMYYVLTLYKENKFEFMTRDGHKIVMKCNSKEDQITFIEGVKHYLPHAQFGYSLPIDIVYDDDREHFLDTLKAKGIYTPIDMIKS